MKSIRVAVDAMGGDHGASEVMAAVAEVSLREDLVLAVFGRRAEIAEALSGVEHDPGRIEIHEASSVIDNHEPARRAIEEKPEASLCRAMRAVAAGEADALMSAGSTGAMVLAAAKWLPRIPGVDRAALAAVYPTPSSKRNQAGMSLLLDVGATVRCRPQDLLYFAYMGRAYASRVLGRPSPTIGLLNMGVEASKGGDVLAEAHALLQADPLLNFVGNVEGNDVPMGRVDVVVCEGLVGNVALKVAEGMGELLRGLGKWAFKQSFTWRVGLMLLSGGLRRLKDVTDYAEYGGAPLLGFTAPVIKAHGRSERRALVKAIERAARAARDGLCSDIAAAVVRYQERDVGSTAPP